MNWIRTSILEKIYLPWNPEANASSFQVWDNSSLVSFLLPGRSHSSMYLGCYSDDAIEAGEQFMNKRCKCYVNFIKNIKYRNKYKHIVLLTRKLPLNFRRKIFLNKMNNVFIDKICVYSPTHNHTFQRHFCLIVKTFT